MRFYFTCLPPVKYVDADARLDGLGALLMRARRYCLPDMRRGQRGSAIYAAHAHADALCDALANAHTKALLMVKPGSTTIVAALPISIRLPVVCPLTLHGFLAISPFDERCLSRRLSRAAFRRG